MSKELKTKSKQASEIVTTVASESSQLVIGYSILSDFCVPAYSILFVFYLSYKMLQGSSGQHALFQFDPGIVGVQGPKGLFQPDGVKVWGDQRTGCSEYPSTRFYHQVASHQGGTDLLGTEVPRCSKYFQGR